MVQNPLPLDKLLVQGRKSSLLYRIVWHLMWGFDFVHCCNCFVGVIIGFCRTMKLPSVRKNSILAHLTVRFRTCAVVLVHPCESHRPMASAVSTVQRYYILFAHFEFFPKKNRQQRKNYIIAVKQQEKKRNNLRNKWEILYNHGIHGNHRKSM